MPVLELVTLALQMADRPMRPYEVHAAATELYGRPLRWRSVTATLSAYTLGKDHRFRCVQHGVYELACTGLEARRRASAARERMPSLR